MTIDLLARLLIARGLTTCRSSAAKLALAALLAGAATQAIAEPYNPRGLGDSQLGRINEICQSTMGLSPEEPPPGLQGAAQDPHLDPGENHYQGCVASLSDAQGQVNEARATVQADTECRAKGLVAGTPGLADCVLHWRDQAAVEPVDEPVRPPRAHRGKSESFFTARPPEIAWREREACAQLGLQPGFPAFRACVAHMDRTFSRIENPQS